MSIIHLLFYLFATTPVHSTGLSFVLLQRNAWPVGNTSPKESSSMDTGMLFHFSLVINRRG